MLWFWCVGQNRKGLPKAESIWTIIPTTMAVLTLEKWAERKYGWNNYAFNEFMDSIRGSKATWKSFVLLFLICCWSFLEGVVEWDVGGGGFEIEDINGDVWKSASSSTPTISIAWILQPTWSRHKFLHLRRETRFLFHPQYIAETRNTENHEHCGL